MPTGVFLALSNPVSGEIETEFNDWYDNVHAKEVLALDGIRSCRRFRLASAQVMPGDDVTAHRYLALYEVETDDWAALAAAFQNGFAEGRITIRPDLLELDPMVLTLAFEELDTTS
jgi:hypothetical protein